MSSTNGTIWTSPRLCRFFWFACVGFYALSRVFQLFNDDSSQIHFLWTIFNQYLNSPLYWHWRDNRSAIPIILFHYTDLEKAECLNEYFSSISNVDESNACLPPFHPKNCNILNITDITRQQIEDIISTLEVNKAAGPDLISHKLLKNIKQSISKPLQILFNKSLLDQTFPQTWKH